jgi:hypothetical protein
MVQSFTSSLIISKHPPTVELWEFAARYALPELEDYCLDSKSVYENLLKVLGDHDQGLAHFSRLGIPTSKLNALVARTASAALQKSCFFCLSPPSDGGRSPPITPRVPPPPTTSRQSVNQM